MSTGNHTSQFLGLCMACLLGCAGNVDVGDASTAGPGGGGSSASSGGAAASSAAQGGSSTGGQAAAGAGGSGGEEPLTPTCEALKQVTISDPVLIPLAGPSWTSGTSATVRVTLTSPVDNVDYPGIEVTHTTNGVTPPLNDNYLFGLVAGEGAPIGVDFAAAPAIASGTTVSFAIRVVTIAEDCPGLDSITFQTQIQ